MSNPIKSFVLVILDGWGYRAASVYNAIANAHTPHWDYLWQHYPHMLIEGSGHSVGLPAGQMGNSEVGHLTMGAGRVVYQELTRIEKAIAEGSFFANPVFNQAIDKAIATHAAVHIMGLLSPGGVHSHEQQIEAIINLALTKGAPNVYLHAFLDGRDTPPQSAKASLEKIGQIAGVKIASVMGRYYAMDRDKRWQRTQQAYDLLTLGKSDYHADNAMTALAQAYARGETDEFVKPTTIHADNGLPVTIKDNDVVIFMNFRADRARQLTYAFTDKDFSGFPRQFWPVPGAFVTLTQYADDIQAQVAYPPQPLKNVLGEYLADLGLHQYRLAETEKYAHVTFFFNGGRETPFANEERLLISSPKVATYDLQPEMSAHELTQALVNAVQAQQYHFIVCNYANPDMVGHTGNYPATIKAIETIDHCLGQIYQAVQSVGGELLITADHGNAEYMFNENTQQPHTAHTSDPVPLIYTGRPAQFTAADGCLADIAPTLLYLMHLPQPQEMTGKCLLKLL